MDRVAQGGETPGLIEQDARVVAVADGVAWVEAKRASACGSCSVASGCGTSVIAKLFGEGPSRFEVTDPIGVEVGDLVVVGIADSALTRASVIAYLLPLVALIGFALVVKQAGAGEGLVALSGIAGLALGLWGSGRLVGRDDARERYRPVLLRRRSLAPGMPVSGPIGI